MLAAVWIGAGLVLALIWAAQRPTIEVNWQTESEIGSAGFNVLRGDNEDGPFDRVNERLIPSSADAVAGGDYAIVDKDVVGGQRYYYILEDVELNGDVTRHDLIVVDAPGRPHVLLLLGLVLVVVSLAFMVLAWRAHRELT